MTRSTAAAAVGLAFVLMLAATASASTPTISYSIDGIVGTNGWYRGSTHGDNVILHWSVSLDATSSNCLAAVTIPGPTVGTTQTCWATNADGRATAVTREIRIDATPPTGVTARFSRRPDHNGWYNHPVTIRWSGTDSISGIGYCTSGTYRGPDSAAATLNGGCFDRAGNSAGRQVHLAYDATPPVLRNVGERSTVAADVLSWSSSSTSDRIVVRRRVRGSKARTTVFDGSAGGFSDKKIHPATEYIYSVRSFDQAGNSSRVVKIVAPPKVLILRTTPYVPRAAPNPILRWRPVDGAGYYNVQLFRGSRRIYAAWPTTQHLALPATWRWSGHSFRLWPGRYRWYVWAGFGARALANYRFVGSARFVIPRG
jgi:hypothetical protein